MYAITACAAGIACKESAAVAPLLIMLYDATFRAPSNAALRAAYEQYLKSPHGR
jgi:hypothetical protein